MAKLPRQMLEQWLNDYKVAKPLVFSMTSSSVDRLKALLKSNSHDAIDIYEIVNCFLFDELPKQDSVTYKHVFEPLLTFICQPMTGDALRHQQDAIIVHCQGLSTLKQTFTERTLDDYLEPIIPGYQRTTIREGAPIVSTFALDQLPPPYVPNVPSESKAFTHVVTADPVSPAPSAPPASKMALVLPGEPLQEKQALPVFPKDSTSEPLPAPSAPPASEMALVPSEKPLQEEQVLPVSPKDPPSKPPAPALVQSLNSDAVSPNHMGFPSNVTLFGIKESAPGPQMFQPHESTAERIRAFDSAMNSASLCQAALKAGGSLNKLTWVDTGRDAFSCVGPNISDVTLKVFNGRQEFLMSMLSSSTNYRDKTVDVLLSQMVVPVMQHGVMQSVPLADFLKNIAHYIPKTSYGKSLLRSDGCDEELLCSAQMCFLPEVKDGIEYAPAIKSYRGNVLTIICSPLGVAVHDIKDSRPTTLFHANEAGQSVRFNASTKKDFAERYGATEESGIADGRDVMYIIQVPMKDPTPPRVESRGAAVSYGGPSLIAKGGGNVMTRGARISFAPVAIDAGSVVGAHDHTIRQGWIRDDACPIRVTMQSYKFADQVTPGDITAQVNELREMVTKISMSGPATSLVVDMDARAQRDTAIEAHESGPYPFPSTTPTAKANQAEEITYDVYGRPVTASMQPPTPPQLPNAKPSVVVGTPYPASDTFTTKGARIRFVKPAAQGGSAATDGDFPSSPAPGK